MMLTCSISTAMFTVTILLLLIIKMVTVNIAVEIEQVNIIRILRQVLHSFEQYFVFIVNTIIIGEERLIPNIRICNRMWHLILVSKVSVFNVLSQPVCCIVNPFSGNRNSQPFHGSKESVMLVNMLILLFRWVQC